MSTMINLPFLDIDARLDTRRLTGCLGPHPSRPINLSECVPLFPAATGSTTLDTAFHNLRAFSSYYDRRRSTLLHHGYKRGLPSHTHAFSVARYLNITRLHQLPAPRCYVMTVRDPVARFESGLLDALAVNGKEARLLGPISQHNRTSARLVAMLRDASSDAYRMYANSVAAPEYASIWHHGFGPRNGSYFWTAQLDYLRGLEGVDCASASAPRLVPICTERLTADLRELLRASGAPMPANLSQLGGMHLRRRRPPSGICKVCASAWLSAEDADFVRRTLFPWDGELHALACGSRVATRQT